MNVKKLNSPVTNAQYVEDENHVIKRVRLSDQTYAEAISSFIVVCVDAIIIDKAHHTLWLGTRKAKPMQGIWIIGGRRFAGEWQLPAIRRCFKRETSLDLPEDRFTFVKTAEYTWKDRQQEPQDVGCHSLSDTFCIELTPEEREVVTKSLDTDEYQPGGLKEFNREELVAAEVHPVLLDFYDTIFSSR